MNYKMMGRFISRILIVEAVFMLPPLIIALFEKNMQALKGFGFGILAAALAGLLLFWLCRDAQKQFYAKEGLACVGLSWIVMALVGSLPFFVSGEIPDFMDALFEIVSGFTTTGASILNNVEGLSQSMLFWRSFSHWIGGMGVLVFLLALSANGEQGSGFTMHLLRAESPGPNVGKLVPKMRTTARILYLIYIVLTILNFLLLVFGGMSVFESVCTAFSTAGTGGFAVKNDSMAGYSPYIQNVSTVFMLLFGVNFSCYYMMLLKHFREVVRDEELRAYLAVVFVSIVLIVLDLRGFYDTIGETIRHASFQVASIISSTGYATTDYDLWPGFSKGILFVLMFIGACAGSTGGGLKVGRAMLLIKGLNRNMRRMLNPQRVEVVRINGNAVGEKVLQNTDTYLAAYVLILLVSFVCVSVDGLSVMTNMSAVVTCFNNIGPGLELVGPTCNFSLYSGFSKLVLILDMLAGRLEIFPMLILASRSTWRHR